MDLGSTRKKKKGHAEKIRTSAKRGVGKPKMNRKGLRRITSMIGAHLREITKKEVRL